VGDTVQPISREYGVASDLNRNEWIVLFGIDIETDPPFEVLGFRWAWEWQAHITSKKKPILFVVTANMLVKVPLIKHKVPSDNLRPDFNPDPDFDLAPGRREFIRAEFDIGWF
jgi:hypothetical protein